MAATVDLCNQALSLIGAGRIASLDEASPEARECKLWWEPVRKQVLRAAFWNSARKRVDLVLRQEKIGSWAYTYTYPPDCLNARFIDASDGKFPVFAVGMVKVAGGYDKVIMTNAANASLWYVFDNDDPTTWDSLLQQAVVDALAGSIAVGLTGKASFRVELFQKANVSILQARMAAAAELRVDLTVKPSKLVAMDDWTEIDISNSPYIAPDGPLFQ